jgi:hypothetical protein
MVFPARVILVAEAFVSFETGMIPACCAILADYGWRSSSRNAECRLRGVRVSNKARLDEAQIKAGRHRSERCSEGSELRQETEWRAVDADCRNTK